MQEPFVVRGLRQGSCSTTNGLSTSSERTDHFVLRPFAATLLAMRSTHARDSYKLPIVGNVYTCPGLTAILAYAALRDGADGIIIFRPIFQEMMEHPLTDTWNETFMGEWVSMHETGLLAGVPVRLD